MNTDFSNLPDKDQAWQDLCGLIQDNNNSVRRIAARTLKEAFNQVLDKERAWQDLLRLMRISDCIVRLEVGLALDEALDLISDEKQFRSDFAELLMCDAFGYSEAQRMLIFEKFEASRVLKKAFRYVPDKEQTSLDLIDFMREWYCFVNPEDVISFQPLISGAYIPQFRTNRDRKGPTPFVRIAVARALKESFSHIPDDEQAFRDLLWLAHDDDRHIRMFANFYLGKASVLKATRAQDNCTLENELGTAVTYFERSSREQDFGPAKFCHPFYRTYLAITFQRAKEDEVQKYLAKAKDAVGSSRSKGELLKAVENLAEALRRSQGLKTRVC